MLSAELFGETWRSSEKILNDVHVAEIFSPPRVTAETHRFGLSPGMALDIRTGWNLDDPRKLKQLWEYLRTERPMLIIGSPECKAFSSLQSLNRDSPNFKRTLQAGIRHMRIMMQIYQWQAAQGRWFLHENPFHNWSCSLKEVQELVNSPEVLLVKTGQYMFGQSTVDGDGKVVVVRKRAGFLTNCREIRDELSVVCDKSHSHGSLLGQGRAGRAAVYPPRLVAVIFRGLRKGLEQSVNAIDIAEAGPTVEEECPVRQDLLRRDDRSSFGPQTRGSRSAGGA